MWIVPQDFSNFIVLKIIYFKRILFSQQHLFCPTEFLLAKQIYFLNNYFVLENFAQQKIELSTSRMNHGGSSYGSKR